MTEISPNMNPDWQEYSKIKVPYVVIPDLFSSDECSQILAFFEDKPLEEGATWSKDGYVVNPSARSVKTHYSPRTEANDWIYERMDKGFFQVANTLGIDVRETIEDLKYLCYREGDHFSGWHIDIGSERASMRKISVSIELNDPSEYEGGSLQVFPEEVDYSESGAFGDLTRKRGTAVFFPSFRSHRVTPVTRGVRHVMVNWISGPPFR